MYVAIIAHILPTTILIFFLLNLKEKSRCPAYREDEEPIDASDIRKILLACNNRRLKTLLLFLASGAMRVTECLAIRNMDIDFTVSPTKMIKKRIFKD